MQNYVQLSRQAASEKEKRTEDGCLKDGSSSVKSSYITIWTVKEGKEKLATQETEQ